VIIDIHPFCEIGVFVALDFDMDEDIGFSSVKEPGFEEEIDVFRGLARF
jgi:hypothetical protein